MGASKGCSEMQQAEGFSPLNDGLEEFQSELWQGFVFVKFERQGQAAGRAARAAEFKIEAWRMDELDVIIELEFNWRWCRSSRRRAPAEAIPGASLPSPASPTESGSSGGSTWAFRVSCSS